MAAMRRPSHVPTSAILLIMGSVLCFTLLDTITKFMTQRYAVAVLVWARYAVQLVAMLLWLGPSMRLDLLRTRRLLLQVVRGALLLASSMCFVSALRALPLAVATAINYTTPVLVVVMAILFLAERPTPARIAFVIAGLTGMTLIVRPGSDLFQGAALLALAAAFFYAAYQVLTRKLHGENPRVLLFYPAVVGTTIMTLAAPGLDWPAQMPSTHVALIICGGLLGTLGHFLFIHAFRYGPAAALTPFTYMQLVWATLFGWLVYHEFPDGWTFAGMGVIALSGLLITLHERRIARSHLTGPVTVQ
jgi:drug/metabolite transporter (DMT)-like permease